MLYVLGVSESSWLLLGFLQGWSCLLHPQRVGKVRRGHGAVQHCQPFVGDVIIYTAKVIEGSLLGINCQEKKERL